MTEAPQCTVCTRFMPDSFRDFKICVACFALQERMHQNHPTLRQPTYETAYQRLERDNRGRNQH